MNPEHLKSQFDRYRRQIQDRHWPELVHWLETRSPRSLFLRAVLIGLLISVPWQCSRVVYNHYFKPDSGAVSESAAPLNTPARKSSVTGMPDPKARRPVPMAPPQTPVAEQPPAQESAPTEEPGTAMADHDARVLERTAPKYPAESLRNGESGTVTVRVRIDASGAAIDTAIENSSGSRALDRAARQAVLQWRFAPKTENGAAVESELLIPVDFKLAE